QDRAGAGAEDVDRVAQVLMPEVFAVEVEGVDAAAAEVDEKPFAVGDRRAGGEAVLQDLALVVILGLRRGEFLAPAFLARLAIECEHVTHQLGSLLAREASNEHLILPDDRTGGAGPGELHFPGDVLIGTPFKRQRLLRTDAVAKRSAETGPIRGRTERGG